MGRVEEVPAGISGLVWGGWAVVHRPAGPGTAGAGTRLRWWGGSLQRRGRIGGNLQGCGRSGRESGVGVLVAACLGLEWSELDENEQQTVAVSVLAAAVESTPPDDPSILADGLEVAVGISAQDVQDVQGGKEVVVVVEDQDTYY